MSSLRIVVTLLLLHLLLLPPDAGASELQALSDAELAAYPRQTHHAMAEGKVRHGYKFIPASSTRALIVTYQTASSDGSPEPEITSSEQSRTVVGSVSGVTLLTKHYYILEDFFVHDSETGEVSPIHAHITSPIHLSSWPLVEQGLSAVATALRETFARHRKSKSIGGVFGVC